MFGSEPYVFVISDGKHVELLKHFLLFDFDHGFLFFPGFFHVFKSLFEFDEFFGKGFFFEGEFLNTLVLGEFMSIEPGFRTLNFCDHRCQKFLVSDEFLDDGVVDFIFFKGQIFLLNLLDFELELNEFVLLEFHVGVHFHFLVFEFGVFFDSSSHFGLQFTVFVFDGSSVKAFSILMDLGEIHDFLFEHCVLDFHVFDLVVINCKRFYFVLESSQLGFNELVAFALKLVLGGFLFEPLDEFFFSGKIFVDGAFIK